MVTHILEVTIEHISQACPKSGPGAKCGPPVDLIWPPWEFGYIYIVCGPQGHTRYILYLLVLPWRGQDERHQIT